MYCKPSPGTHHKRHIRTLSVSSQPTRRSSMVSVLSERRPSYQFMRQCSDAGVILHRRKSEMTMDARGKVAFSPTLEPYDEEVLESNQTEQFTSMGSLGNTNTYVEQDEDCEEVLGQLMVCSGDEEPTDVDQGREKTTHVDQDGKATTVDQDEEVIDVSQGEDTTNEEITTNVGQDEEINKLDQNKEALSTKDAK